MSQDEKRAVAAEKAQTLYDELHHVLGHRSREHTVRQIEWMYGQAYAASGREHARAL